MTSKKQRILAGIGIFVAGLAAGFAGGVYAGDRALQDYYNGARLANMQAGAERAQTELIQLRWLRSGRVQKVVDQLEAFIDLRSSSMKRFDQSFPASREAAFNRKILGQIRVYRTRYPRQAQ